jgi:nicotinate phosphoribosyltransferase
MNARDRASAGRNQPPAGGFYGYPPSGLRTDLYELTMMNGYLHAGLAGQQVVFDLFLRSIPEQGGYCVAAGLADVVRFVLGVRFAPVEIDYLRGLGLFSTEFLERLEDFAFTGDLYSVPEGTLVFPLEPILRVHAPLFQAQFLESALLNTINFQTLIATKAARVCHEAGTDNVMEFGMRRAHGVDGSLSATRAAYIGGVESTSNTEAGRLLGIPVRGTQAHSWIMAFPDELTAFRAYAETYPEQCVLLVDTYDTLRSGVPHAIQVGRELAQRGGHLRGIRLDSGDLAYLSIRARQMLDEAGLHETRIIASGDLDEWIIHDLTIQGARIDVWGVGTRLVTSHNEPSLTGVYKLAAIEQAGGWMPCLKIAERATKSTIPGIKQVWRMKGGEQWLEGDLIAQAHEDVRPGDPGPVGHHPLIEYEKKRYDGITIVEPLLQPVILGGRLVYEPPPLAQSRRRTREHLDQLHPTSRRLLNPHIYKVSLSEETLRIRQELRERVAEPPAI